MKKETVIVALANVPVFFFNLIKKRNLTIRGFVKYAAAFYKAFLVLTGANSKSEELISSYIFARFSKNA